MTTESRFVSIDEDYGPYRAMVRTDYRWNGWACPTFDAATARHIVDLTNRYTRDSDPEGPTMTMGDDGVVTMVERDGDETFTTTWHGPGYPIGAMSWVWDEWPSICPSCKRWDDQGATSCTDCGTATVPSVNRWSDSDDPDDDLNPATRERYFAGLPGCDPALFTAPAT